MRDFCEYSGIWKNRNNDTTEEHRFEGRFLYMRFLNNPYALDFFIRDADIDDRTK